MKKHGLIQTEFVIVGRGRFPAGLGARIRRVLKRSGLIAFPTETVYGLAAGARDARAIRRLCALKGRSAARALTVQVPGFEDARKMIKPDWRFDVLGRRFWPGPLTLVARASQARKTVGIRIPAHAISLRVLKEARVPLAVTSLNRSGEPELRTFGAIKRFARNRIDLVILSRSGGRGKASTVCDLSQTEPKLLREGPIGLADIHKALHERFKSKWKAK